MSFGRAPREERRFSEQRAGAYSGQLAREAVDRYARANWRALLVGLLLFVLVGVAIGIGFSQVSGLGWFRTIGWLLGGIIIGLGCGLLYHWTLIESGAAGATMGEAAEQWTNTELRRLRRNDWRTLDHLWVGEREIDHVAIGPDGIVVVETKWRSATLSPDEPDSVIIEAVRQTKHNARQIRSFLREAGKPFPPVEALVVLWGPKVEQESDEPRLIEDAYVVAGKHLRRLLSDLGEERLSNEAIDAAYEKLRSQLIARDERRTAEYGAPEPTLFDQARRWREVVSAGLAGFAAAALSLTLGVWFFPMCACLVAAGVIARHNDRLRPITPAWIAGVLLVVLPTTALVILALV